MGKGNPEAFFDGEQARWVVKPHDGADAKPNLRLVDAPGEDIGGIMFPDDAPHVEHALALSQRPWVRALAGAAIVGTGLIVATKVARSVRYIPHNID